MTVYRKFEVFTFYIGSRPSTHRWTRFWIVAQNRRTGKRWIPWAVYEPTGFLGPTSSYYPRDFSVAVYDPTREPAPEPVTGTAARSRPTMVVYLFGPLMCRCFSFDLLKRAEPPERAFSMFLKPRPELDGQHGNTFPQPDGTASRNVIFMSTLVGEKCGPRPMEQCGPRPMEQFVESSKTIETVNRADGGWRVVVATKTGKHYGFVRRDGDTDWDLASIWDKPEQAP